MSPLHDAQRHLAKANEFALAATANLASGYFNAATSDAVVSGINSKDAICLSRLLRMKTKSQYQTISVAPSDAIDAVGWAEKLLNGAKRIVSG